MPAPLDGTETSLLAGDRLQRVAVDQEAVTGPIGLYEAMARALKYNLDHRVELHQRALRARELSLSHAGLLPDLVASSGYADRDEFAASRSIAIDPLTGEPTGVELLNYNTSQEKQQRTADIAFSWNILDFGLSYVRARQAADQVLIAHESKRKVVNRIVEDVRSAYWRAVSADRLVSRLRTLESRTRRALATTRSLADEQRTSPITALTYERELVEIKRTIQELQRELAVAKTQLATLMNLKPGTTFELVVPPRRASRLELPADLDAMIWTALENRPELRDVTYRQRVNRHEADAALIELLPGLQLYAGTNFDSNEYLLNSDWVSWGAKASWNLIRLLKYPARRDVIEGQDELLDQRALALTMAIMAQVHVSRIRFLHYRRELATAGEYLDVQRRLIEKMRAEHTGGRISEQTLIREEMNALVAEVKYDIAFANLQNGYANVFASMGVDPYAEELVAEMDVQQLAAALRVVWVERGAKANAWKQATAAN